MILDTTGVPYSKAKAYGKGPRAVARQANPVGEARVPVRNLNHAAAYILFIGKPLQTDFSGIGQGGICLRQCL